MKKKFRGQLTMQHRDGLHMRPAVAIVNLLDGVTSRVTFSHNRMHVNAKSLLNLLALGLPCGGVIDVEVHGENPVDVFGDIATLFSNNFHLE